jgi:hypothetical protein
MESVRIVMHTLMLMKHSFLAFQTFAIKVNTYKLMADANHAQHFSTKMRRQKDVFQTLVTQLISLSRQDFVKLVGISNIRMKLEELVRKIHVQGYRS